MESLNLTWEEKVGLIMVLPLTQQMTETQKIHVEREKALEELGISIDKDVS